jgi:hypothetical protein
VVTRPHGWGRIWVLGALVLGLASPASAGIVTGTFRVDSATSAFDFCDIGEATVCLNPFASSDGFNAPFIAASPVSGSVGPDDRVVGPFPATGDISGLFTLTVDFDQRRAFLSDVDLRRGGMSLVDALNAEAFFLEMPPVLAPVDGTQLRLNSSRRLVAVLPGSFGNLVIEIDRVVDPGRLDSDLTMPIEFAVFSPGGTVNARAFFVAQRTVAEPGELGLFGLGLVLLGAYRRCRRALTQVASSSGGSGFAIR